MTGGVIRSAEELSCEERRKINKHSLWRRRLLLLLLLVALLCWHWWPMSSLEGPIMRSYAWSVKRNKNSWVILPLPSFELMKAPSCFSWLLHCCCLTLWELLCCIGKSYTDRSCWILLVLRGECTFDAGLHSSFSSSFCCDACCKRIPTLFSTYNNKFLWDGVYHFVAAMSELWLLISSATWPLMN